MIQPWKKNRERTDYDCGFFQVSVQHSASPITGKEHPFYVLSTRNWTNVIALTPEKKLLMVEQFRHGSQALSLEVPGGAVDPQESPLEAAKRELREETGYEADEWHLLGDVRPNPAILDNHCHLYLALGARPAGELRLDEAEELEVSLHDLERIPGLVQSGRIHHSLVLAAFLLLDLFKAKNPGKI
ncbi:MAG TPA: NUDIX hydrolase [bacterium]|nr:NUDIX hydrolase [bacterium]